MTTATIHRTPRRSADPSPAQIEAQSIQLQRELLAIVREETGMVEPIAQAVAVAIERGLRKRFGCKTLGAKGSIYVPAPDKTERNAAILADFDGTNAEAVAKRHGISLSTLYRLIRPPA